MVWSLKLKDHGYFGITFVIGRTISVFRNEIDSSCSKKSSFDLSFPRMCICNFITVWECVDIYRSESDICLHVRLHNFHHNAELLFIHFIQSSQYCGGCWWNHFFLSLSALFIYGGLGVQNYTLHTHCICKLQTHSATGQSNLRNLGMKIDLHNVYFF